MPQVENEWVGQDQWSPPWLQFRMISDAFKISKPESHPQPNETRSLRGRCKFQNKKQKTPLQVILRHSEG